MDEVNLNNQIENLKQGIKNYKDEISHLKTKIWDLLRHFNNKDEYIQLVLDTLRRSKHTDFDEIDYLIEEIYKIYKYISESEIKKVDQLSGNREELVNRCRVLKESVIRQEKLLEEADQEIEALKAELQTQKEGVESLELKSKNHKEALLIQEKANKKQASTINKQANAIKILQNKLHELNANLNRKDNTLPLSIEEEIFRNI